MRLSECRGQACLNYAEHEHLRRSQLEMRNCHTGCKNHETKKREELIELTVNNYSQPTTLPLRTYHLTTTNLQPYYYLTTTNTRSTKGTPKVKGGENNLHKIDVVEVGWSMSTTSIDRCRRRRFRGYGGTLLKHTQESNGRK